MMITVCLPCIYRCCFVSVYFSSPLFHDDNAFLQFYKLMQFSASWHTLFFSWRCAFCASPSLAHTESAIATQVEFCFCLVSSSQPNERCCKFFISNVFDFFRFIYIYMQQQQQQKRHRTIEIRPKSFVSRFPCFRFSIWQSIKRTFIVCTLQWQQKKTATIVFTNLATVCCSIFFVPVCRLSFLSLLDFLFSTTTHTHTKCSVLCEKQMAQRKETD